jgi:hypothetical protein
MTALLALMLTIFSQITPEYAKQVHRLKPVSACFIAWWP